MFENNSNNNLTIFKEVINDDDIIIVDRGFRRVKKRTFDVRLPLSIAKTSTKLTSAQANSTRCVTYTRNIIERCIARLKQWKILGLRLPCKTIPICHQIVCILASTENLFFCPLSEDSQQKEQDVQTIINNQNVNYENTLNPILNESSKNFKKKATGKYGILQRIRDNNYLPIHYSQQTLRNFCTGNLCKLVCM